MNKIVKISAPALGLSLLIISEFIMGWCPYVFRVTETGVIVTWGDVLYHLFVKSAFIIPVIVLAYTRKNKIEKLGWLSLLFWYAKDLLDKLYYVAEHKIEWIQHNLFFSITENDIGFIFQLTISILVIIFGIIASTQCTLFLRFLAAFSWPYWSRSSFLKKRLPEKSKSTTT